MFFDLREIAMNQVSGFTVQDMDPSSIQRKKNNTQSSNNKDDGKGDLPLETRSRFGKFESA